MPSLRSLLSDIAPPTNKALGVIYVYGDNVINSPNHNPCTNGKCCLFTVPDGVTSVTFELWAGGGSGGNGYCKWPMNTAGAGGYARRTIQTSAGCQYTVCAANRTGVCCTNGSGIVGCKSFVTGSGIAATCTWGGQPGCNCCYSYGSVICYGPCVVPRLCNCGDFSISGVRATNVARGCFWRTNEIASGAPIYGNSGTHANVNGCCCRRNGENRGNASFPGGGGASGVSCRCGACGASGSSGLVKITYS